VTSPRRASHHRTLPPWLWVLLAVSLLANLVLGVRATRTTAQGSTESEGVDRTPARSEKTPLPPDLIAYAALGTYVAANNRIPDLEWTDAQFNAFVEGLRACYAGKPYPFNDDAKELRDHINERVQGMLALDQTDPVEEYFALLRDREGVQRTGSNLHYRVTELGAGDPPEPNDLVVVSYASRLPGGQSVPSLTRGRVRVKVGDLLPGLSEGVQLLRPGGKALVYLAPALSFAGGSWPPDVPRGSPVAVFLELHEVVRDDW
jgi:FKBP-type peptidyl-prolyl cis-trans isomerase FkpA